MRRHTLGPWWMHSSYEGRAIEKGLIQEVSAVGPKEGGREQQESDARLISADPELLDALVGLLRKVECGKALQCELCGAAREAIAKAAGESA